MPVLFKLSAARRKISPESAQNIIALPLCPRVIRVKDVTFEREKWRWGHQLFRKGARKVLEKFSGGI